MITKIRGSGIKGHTFNHNLKPMTVFTGDNTSGKTAVLDGLVLLIHKGSHPSYKSNVVGKLISQTANVEVNDGAARIAMKRTPADGISVVEQYCRSDFSLPPNVMLAREYMALTAAKRIEKVFALADITKAGFNPAQITADVKNISIGENNEHSELAIQTVIKDLVAINGLLPAQEWIVSAVEKIKARTTEANAALKRMTGTVQGISELAAMNQKNEASSANIEKDLATARTELGKLQEKKGGVDAQIRDTRQKQSRRAELELLTKEPAPECDVEKLTAELTELRKATDDFEDESGEIGGKINTANAKAGDLESDKLRHEMQAGSLRKRIIQLEEMECCPTCKADGTGWKKKLLKEIEAEITAAEKEIKRLGVEIVALEKEITANRKELETALKDKQRYNSNIQRIYTIQSLLDASRVMEAKRQNAAGELRALQKIGDVDGMQAESDEFWSAINAKKEAIQELERQKNALIAERSENNRILQAREQGLKIESEVKVCKEAVKILAEKQAKMVGFAFGKILGNANKLFSRVLPEVLEYRNDELGFNRNGTWVSHETFSGAETALTHAALSFSLATDTAEKLVIIDELGNFSETNRIKLLEALNDLCKDGVITQFIGCLPGKINKSPAWLNVIEV